MLCLLHSCSSYCCSMFHEQCCVVYFVHKSCSISKLLEWVHGVQTHSIFIHLFHTLYLLTHPSHVIPHTLHSHTLPITHIHTCVRHSHPHTHTIITHTTCSPHQRLGCLALPPHPPVGPPSMPSLLRFLLISVPHTEKGLLCNC